MIRRATGWIGAHPVLAFAAFFAVFPFVVPYKALATQVLIFGLFALGFNLLYGYTGLLSFGHAAYWGLGAYGTGIALAKLKLGSVWLALGMGLATAVIGGAVVGFFALRRRGIYFAMLTLAFAQLLYFIAFHMADLTGGDDGLRGIALGPLGIGPWAVSIDSSLAFYYFAFVLVTLAVAFLKRLLDSPFGAVLQAIRENADRAGACGYDVTRVKHLSFVFSALFAGLANLAGRGSGIAMADHRCAQRIGMHDARSPAGRDRRENLHRQRHQDYGQKLLQPPAHHNTIQRQNNHLQSPKSRRGSRKLVCQAGMKHRLYRRGIVAAQRRTGIILQPVPIPLPRHGFSCPFPQPTVVQFQSFRSLLEF